MDPLPTYPTSIEVKLPVHYIYIAFLWHGGSSIVEKWDGDSPKGKEVGSRTVTTFHDFSAQFLRKSAVSF
jgi:hypothetical protein